MHERPLHRRRFLRSSLLGGAALLLACGSARRRTDAAAPPVGPRSAPSPDPPALASGEAAPRDGETRGGVCVPTEPNIEGPFFKAGAPQRSVLAEPGAQGRALTVSGRVLGLGCGPVAAALLEVWQADHEGAYDNEGFTHRGQLRADDAGRFRFDTIMPGRYLNGAQYRPAHIHVKVHVPGSEVLTTQLYFEGDPYNDVDPWLRPSLVMRPRPRYNDGGLDAGFDFVVG